MEKTVKEELIFPETLLEQMHEVAERIAYDRNAKDTSTYNNEFIRLSELKITAEQRIAVVKKAKQLDIPFMVFNEKFTDIIVKHLEDFDKAKEEPGDEEDHSIDAHEYGITGTNGVQ